MFSIRWIKYGIMTLGLLFFLTYILELDAFARAGGGRSMGSRGSRSYSAPRSPSATPSSPQPSAPMTQPQSGGFLRGMGGGILGGLAGGILGGMLMRSMGFASGGLGSGSGVGLFEIILIGLILYGIWWFIKKKRQEAGATAGSAYYREASMPEARPPSSFAPSYGQPAIETDREGGNLSQVRQMDPTFDEKRFTDQCMDTFFKIQGAWASRNMTAISSLLTDEMQRMIQGDLDDLRQKRQVSHLENIAVRNVELTEAWQESGQDFITVRFYANLLDYTTDEVTGTVVTGSKTDPVKFEEFWTFARPVGNNPWKLTAINQA